MYLLFEVGGTNTRIGFSSDGENIENTQIIPTEQDFENFLTSLKKNTSNFGEIKIVCGGVPSFVHLPKWKGKALKEELEQAFQVPIMLENDAALGALGEATKGAGAGFPIVAFITVGTGIGGARVVDGKIDNKAQGFEPGHQIIVPDGELCSCGGKGHWEAYIAGSYLEKKYGQKAENIKDTKVWDQVAKYFAIGLHNSMVHWSSDVIVLGGSVSHSIPLEKVKSYLQEFSTIFPQIPEIKLSQLGDQSGLYGALEYLHQRAPVAQ